MKFSTAPIILVTGGHVTPAVSVIETMQSLHPDWKIIFIGRSVAFEGQSVPSEEKRIMEHMGIRFIPITTGRFRAYPSMLSIISLLKFPVGIYQAFKALRTYTPTVIMSFGGYIALPVSLAGWMMRIPVITHEQTRALGVANYIISRFARATCLSYAQSDMAKNIPHSVVTGLPIRNVIYHPPVRPMIAIESSRPIIYITGGITGAMAINQAMYTIVSRLASVYTVVHQTGRLDYDNARVLRQKLRWDKRKHYVIAPYFDGADHAWILHHAQVLVGRAGANTTAEIEHVGIPSILIPLPNSRSGEQLQNAITLKEKGTAQILEESTLDAQQLFEHIQSFVHMHKTTISREIEKQNASEVIVGVIQKALDEN